MIYVVGIAAFVLGLVLGGLFTGIVVIKFLTRIFAILVEQGRLAKEQQTAGFLADFKALSEAAAKKQPVAPTGKGVTN